jgi:hypothetical protein
VVMPRAVESFCGSVMNDSARARRLALHMTGQWAVFCRVRTCYTLVLLLPDGGMQASRQAGRCCACRQARHVTGSHRR